MTTPKGVSRVLRRSARKSLDGNDSSLEPATSLPPPQPSAKVLGKRLELQPTDDTTNKLSDKKSTRVLPTRSSRRVPGGSGGSIADALILDAQQRAAANKPILPLDAVFLLTTDSSMLPPNAATQVESVFDDPQVKAAAAAQKIIQTPEFSELPAAIAVGGRLRARGTQEKLTDTSDQVYMNRHRKFETLEKRQRLREKEQLQHERMKLKQRIEQLRSMDGSQFLLYLGDSGAPGHPESSGEGDRRRREMLRDAEELEQRYEELLSERRPSDGTASQSRIISQEPIKLKLRLGKARVSSASQESPPSLSPVPREPPMSFQANPIRHSTSDAHLQLHRHGSGRSSLLGSHSSQDTPTSTSYSATHLQPSSPVSPSSTLLSIDSSMSWRDKPDILRVAAPVNASRSTLRHATAFGVKIPSMIDSPVDFIIPMEWIAHHKGPGSD